MKNFTITCGLTDEQVALLKQVLTKSGITVAEYFQRFWDGYTSEGITMDGAVWAQTKQYMLEKIKEINESLELLKKV